MRRGVVASAFVAPVPDITYLGFVSTTTRAKTQTIPDVYFGEEFPGRRIVLAVAAQTDSALGDLSSATLNGQPLSVDGTSGISRGLAAIASGIVPGSSGSLTLVAGATTNMFYPGVKIGIFALSGSRVPVYAAGGFASDASVSVPGADGGITIIALASTREMNLVSPDGATIHNMSTDTQSRQAAYISGVGPFVLDANPNGSVAYDRIVGVTYA